MRQESHAPNEQNDFISYLDFVEKIVCLPNKKITRFNRNVLFTIT